MSFRSGLLVTRGLIIKRLVLLRRYPLNTATQFITLYFVFLLLVVGGQALAPETFAESTSGIIVGYLLWTMAIGAYSALSWDLIRESQWGTLEQLFLSPVGFGRVTVLTVAVNLLESFLWGAGILLLMLQTTGTTIQVDLLTVVPVILLTLASAIGIGFLTGGLAVLYKRVENLFSVMRLLFIGFIAAPIEAYPVLQLLPLSFGTRLLHRAMVDGVRLWEFPIADLGFLLVKAAIYLLGGFLLFQLLQRKTRERGVLGHY
ncbi:MAG: ABC transporter permease [Halobacteriales archaeon]|nr:ABC transporter permease [Halobacteriales archaeon]